MFHALNVMPISLQDWDMRRPSVYVISSIEQRGMSAVASTDGQTKA